MTVVLGADRNALHAIRQAARQYRARLGVGANRAAAGDPAPLDRLLNAVTRPYEERPGLDRFAAPAPADFGATYRTFCGT